MLVVCLVIMPDDPKGPNPIKLKKPFRLNPECYWHVKKELFEAIEMFMDHIDFDLKPWDTEDPETGKKEIYIQDKNILRKMYKLKNIYENPQRQKQQPNSSNWNFGTIPAHLLKKS